MIGLGIALAAVQLADFEDMVALRMVALRESLERLSRFNPDVAVEAHEFDIEYRWEAAA